MTFDLEAYLDFDEILNDLYANNEWFQLKSPKGSMSNAELFFIYYEIKKIKPRLVFESGVATGRSSAVLADCMKNYGKVISANYRHDDEKHHMFPIIRENLQVIDGRGEDVIRQINKKQPILAVIDGPKPSGYLYGHTGWIELMDYLINVESLCGVFQHDVVGKAKEKFDNYFKSNLQIDFTYTTYTTFFNSFIDKPDFYGNDHTLEPSLVFLEKKKTWLI